MKFNVFVGTHHKTGTHWMLGVFNELARVLNVPFINISKMDEASASKKIESFKEKGRKVIVFHEHSRFPQHAYEEGSRGIHMIRDPLDVLISAVRYHESTDAKWVNTPKKKYGGRSIKEVISSLDDFQDKLLFEIDDVGKKNIVSLSDFSRGDSFVDVKYEDLVVDDNLRYSAHLFDFLGFDLYEIAIGCGVMWRNSLFGTLRNVKNDHVKDGSAKQYLKVYGEATRQRFDEKYGGVRYKLGYHDNLIPGEGRTEFSHHGPLVHEILDLFSLDDRDNVIEKAMRRCIEDFPHRPSAYMLLIKEYVDRAEYSKAALVSDSLLSALEGDAAKSSYIVDQVSSLFIKVGRFEDAERLLSVGVLSNPEWEQGWYKLYRVKRRLRGELEAEEVLKEGLMKNPSSKKLREISASLFD